ncbi:hypothetical protein O9992_24175 [Vibrio lentus]|nr:hypothetical protein [Vibrio lentus]
MSGLASTGNFQVKWSGEHQQARIAEVPLSITTEGAALARAGTGRSLAYVKPKRNRHRM